MNKYQTILNKEYQGRLWILFGLILFIIIMTVSLLFIIRKISDKKERIITFIVIAVLLFMLICFAWIAIREAVAIKNDVTSNSFVTYYGKYELRQERNSYYCYIYDGEERIQLTVLFYTMSGEYEGCVVYGKSSMYVVDIYE